MALVAKFCKALLTYVVLVSLFFALGCKSLDIDRLSELIEAFNLDEIAHSVEVFHNTQHGMHEEETILDRAQECLVAIGIVLADEFRAHDVEQEILNILLELFAKLWEFCSDREAQNSTENRERGRPTISVSEDQLNSLVEMGFSYREIAKMLGISDSTLLRRRRELGLDGTVAKRFAVMTDEELDNAVQIISVTHPNYGERMIIGTLRARGIQVQRSRIRDSIGRVDPIGRTVRRLRRRIERRSYSVPCPNALWHIDGNHKLIHWRMVIHGGVDGFSRLIVFMRCSTNNRADTVLQQFLLGTEQFRVPLRIRTDHGTENIAVARWMLDHFGVVNRPVITGMSVHNQRIERMWVDVYKCVLEHYRNIFLFLEDQEYLERDNELHLYALHFVYIPRINVALSDMTAQWNNHPLSTERNMSPLQLWIRGFYMYANSDGSTVQDLLDHTNTNWDRYGTDDFGPDPRLQTNNHVVVPRSSIELNDEEYQWLCNQISPLNDDGNFGVTVYNLCKDTVGHILTQRN